MALQLPQHRALRQIQAAKRQIPVDQIIAIEGMNPVATGINALGTTIGDALEKRAEVKRKAELLAQARAQQVEDFAKEQQAKKDLVNMQHGLDMEKYGVEAKAKAEQEAYNRTIKAREMAMEQEKINISREKKAAEDQVKANKADMTARSLNDRAQLILTKVDQALGKVGPMSAGGMSGTKGLPFIGQMTGATDLGGDLETIKALLGFEQLEQMKAQSRAGSSGLGALSENEMRLLTSARANLEQSQSPEQLRRNLGEVKQHFQNWVSMENGVNPYQKRNLTPITRPGSTMSVGGAQKVGRFTVESQ